MPGVYFANMPRSLPRLALYISAWSSACFGCSCIWSGPPCQAAWQVSAVFLGTVEQLKSDTPEPTGNGAIPVNGFLGTHATFRVAEAFLGMNGRGNTVEVRTGMGGGDCGFPFKLGATYVVYANASKAGPLIASLCSGTKSSEDAEADLAYLRHLQQPLPPFGYVFGFVGNRDGRGRFDPALGAYVPLGLPDAQVTLTGNGQQRTVTAANDGSFRFDRLAPGKYRVSASKSSFSNDYADNELDLHAGGCAYALETLAVDRRISGLIVGSNGLPAPGIQIELVPARPTEFNSLPFPVAETKTDAAGRYELRNLRPGSYYLGINLARTPSPEMPYTRYFFPGVEDPASAAIINVESAPGDHSYDLHIPPPQNQRTVEGNVYWPDGRPAPKVDILLEDPRWPWQTSTIVAATGDNGHFAIPVFDGTAYRVHAVTRAGFIYDAVSAEPQPLVPPVDFNHPLRLVLTKKGHSAAQQIGKGLERWRAGLGL